MNNEKDSTRRRQLVLISYHCASSRRERKRAIAERRARRNCKRVVGRHLLKMSGWLKRNEQYFWSDALFSLRGYAVCFVRGSVEEKKEVGRRYTDRSGYWSGPKGKHQHKHTHTDAIHIDKPLYRHIQFHPSKKATLNRGLSKFNFEQNSFEKCSIFIEAKKVILYFYLFVIIKVLIKIYFGINCMMIALNQKGRKSNFHF